MGIKGAFLKLNIGVYVHRKWTILSLYTYDGCIDWEIIHGFDKCDLFANFLESHLIPCTSPFTGPRSVLIMEVGEATAELNVLCYREHRKANREDLRRF